MSILVDYHVHCQYSDDSTYNMEDVIKDAIKLNLKEICFTDHVDYGVKNDWHSGKEIMYRDGEPLANVDYPNYYKDIMFYKEKYKEQIKIKLGMEFGIQKHTIPLYEKLFKEYPFDFIILSIHQVEDKEFWTQEFQKGKTQEEYNKLYYKEMLDVVNNFKDYSVLGHMDLITRYDNYGVYPFENTKPLIEEILARVIDDDKGLEFNTSYHRYGLKDTTPSIDILKLYKQMGGKIITLGSDSHKKEHLGAYMDEGKKILKELGFKYFTVYNNMKPSFIEL